MRLSIIPTCLLLIYGCSSQEKVMDESTSYTSPSVNYSIDTSEKNIHYYVGQLAQQIFLTSKNIKLNNSIAIGSILPSQDLDGLKLSQLDPVAHQIQESLVTLATQAGLKVIEFKTAKAIKITPEQDIMLSRNIDDLHATINTDYYLTGTYVVQENSLLVNVRLIDVASRNVIAAATDIIPDNVMWNQHKTVMKNNNLYRSAY